MRFSSRAVAFGIAGLGFLAVVLCLFYVAGRFLGAPAQDGPPRTVFYEVRPQEGPYEVAKNLEKLGIVSSARLFYWYSRLMGKTKKFKAGDYRFMTNTKPSEVLAVIMSGVSYGIPITIPEGYAMTQIADLLEGIRPNTKERFLRLCSDRKFISTLGLSSAPPTLEGYLFPDTYFMSRKTPEEDIIKQMVRRYRDVFTAELGERAKAIGFTEHQTVTLASIVEKETGAKEERPLIASVFHNRLKKKMKLQSDPTVIYGIRDYDGNITRRDLENHTPYNTYRIAALPPGPIANPGKEAIVAALYPAKSDYLYFVSHNDGTHEFTLTYDAHRKAVEKFQLDPKAREGKTWRVLKKSSAPTH